MDYISLQIPVADAEQGEILTAELADYPFESFETEGSTLKAYIPGDRLADCKSEVDALLERYGVSGRYIAIETQNWNALWERNYPATDVEGRLRIRAPFHEAAGRGDGGGRDAEDVVRHGAPRHDVAHVAGGARPGGLRTPGARHG